MIRVGDLRRFSLLAADTLAAFPLAVARDVRLTINAPHRTILNVVPMGPDGDVPADAEPMFLAVVDGLTEVHFYVEGAYALEADADVWLSTRDAETFHLVVPDAETFTRIAERRVIDPHLQRIEQALVQANAVHMRAAIEQIERQADLREREREANHRRASAARDDRPEPEPSAGVGGDSGAAPAVVGEEGGDGDA